MKNDEQQSKIIDKNDKGAMVLTEHSANSSLNSSNEEIIQYAKYLGMDIETDQDYFYIAEEGLQADLPPGWEEYTTDKGEIYYFDLSKKKSQWEHPSDEFYKKKFRDQKTADEIKKQEKSKDLVMKITEKKSKTQIEENQKTNIKSIFEDEVNEKQDQPIQINEQINQTLDGRFHFIKTKTKSSKENNNLLNQNKQEIHENQIRNSLNNSRNHSEEKKKVIVLSGEKINSTNFRIDYNNKSGIGSSSKKIRPSERMAISSEIALQSVLEKTRKNLLEFHQNQLMRIELKGREDQAQTLDTIKVQQQERLNSMRQARLQYMKEAVEKERAEIQGRIRREIEDEVFNRNSAIPSDQTSTASNQESQILHFQQIEFEKEIADLELKFLEDIAREKKAEALIYMENQAAQLKAKAIIKTDFDIQLKEGLIERDRKAQKLEDEIKDLNQKWNSKQIFSQRYNDLSLLECQLNEQINEQTRTLKLMDASLNSKFEEYELMDSRHTSIQSTPNSKEGHRDPIIMNQQFVAQNEAINSLGSKQKVKIQVPNENLYLSSQEGKENPSRQRAQSLTKLYSSQEKLDNLIPFQSGNNKITISVPSYQESSQLKLKPRSSSSLNRNVDNTYGQIPYSYITPEQKIDEIKQQLQTIKIQATLQYEKSLRQKIDVRKRKPLGTSNIAKEYDYLLLSNEAESRAITEGVSSKKSITNYYSTSSNIRTQY